MAICATHYEMLSDLQPPTGAAILEIGEANWYGDLDPRGLFPLTENGDAFTIVKDFYRHWCQPSRLVSIDFNGTKEALPLNLNAPLDLGEQFDVVINHGTAEHVFNVAQVFLTIHQHCRDGGLMIHDAPFTGWIDHGFYTFQPTLFYDLAAANNYEIERIAIHEIKSRLIVTIEQRDHIAQLASMGQIPNNALLFVVLRKRGSAKFTLPLQGYYSQSLSAQGMEAWWNLR